MADPVVNPPANTATTSTTQYPEWWQKYVNGVMVTANTVASQPYSP